MQKIVSNDVATLNAVADLTADITDAQKETDLKRLRFLAASALSTQRDLCHTLKHAPSRTQFLPLEYDDDIRETIRTQLHEVETSGIEEPQAFEIRRRDTQESLLKRELVDNLSGLSPSEQLGPFIVEGGAEVWFDIFFATRRLSIIESGESTPALVLTEAKAPVTSNGVTKIELAKGTIWLRGDLINGSLPAGAYTGIKISSGLLTLTGSVVINDDTVRLGGSLRGELHTVLAADNTTPAEKGCRASGAKVELPKSLRFQFNPGPNQVEGGDGGAQVWRQTFKFSHSTNSWFFVNALWTVVLGYEVEPDELDTGLIHSKLINFDGKAQIAGAGLGLPVVVPPDPAILGDVSRAPDWSLVVKDFTARWYEPDPRHHTINEAVVGISGRGAILYAGAVSPLSPAVSHDYMLWSIPGSEDKRTHWNQTYTQNFLLIHHCDIVLGEQLLISGESRATLDRPVQADGSLITIPPAPGVLLLQQHGERVTATLGAAILPDGKPHVHQLVLRNALVWTTRPAIIMVHGRLRQPQQIDAGNALLLFGAYTWVPILPDPYVTNFHTRSPNIRQIKQPQTLLLAKISWRSPNDIEMSFHGKFGAPNITGREGSPGDPKPAPTHKEPPDVGPTQVGQNQLSHDEETAAQWDNAQGKEQEGRSKRLERAKRENEESRWLSDNYLSKVLGSTPNFLLLDVSTNQDLLGVAFGSQSHSHMPTHLNTSTAFEVSRLEIRSQVANMRVVTLPQVQWEPVRTLDPDQDIFTLGWFPTPLASATDGGPTILGTYSQKLVPHTPVDALKGTFEAYSSGIPVAFRTTLPFGLIAVVHLQPNNVGPRPADLYEMTRPRFPTEDSVGGLHITARAEGGRPDKGGISPEFSGHMRQLINGVDLASGTPLGLSVLGSTADPSGSVETIFNSDMSANPRVPVTRFDLSGYGGSNFSDWNNPFAAFAEAAKVQFSMIVGRTALEVIKINSVIHPWGIRVTRSITVERRPGGGVIRRDSGWQPFTPGLFDYRYFDKDTDKIEVAPYTFDAGVFKGLFNVRSIRPASGSAVSFTDSTMVPYYFDAELALEGLTGRTQAIGILGYLQTTPNGKPAQEAALQNLVESQGPIGGPIDAWIDFGGAGLPFRARRIEVGIALNGSNPIFVATVRGVPKLPKTGAWSVVTRPASGTPPGGGEAVPVPVGRGIPLIRRYPIHYPDNDTTVYDTPPLDGPPSAAGDYRFADAADLLVPSAPANDYALLQSTPTHAFLFPRPYVPSSSPPRIQSDIKGALADVIARSTSKGAFPPPQNTIELTAGSLHFDVGTDGELALSSPINIVSHPTPLRLAGSSGHGSTLFYDDATLSLEIEANHWNAEFNGLQIWTDIVGLEKLTGSELRIVGSTNQRAQIAELRTLMLEEIEEILSYIPIFGARGVQGPIDLSASNAKHEIKLMAQFSVTIPPTSISFAAGADLKLKLYVKQSTGFDLEAGGVKASATFGAALNGRIPLLSVGVAAVFLIVTVKIEFSIASLSGTVTSEKLGLLAFVGVGVEGRIGPFSAYAFLGIGFVLSYNIIEDKTKYGGLVALEAGVDLTVVSVILRAELKGLIYDDAGTTKCDYSGKVKLEVEIFLIFSISATYQITETATI